MTHVSGIAADSKTFERTASPRLKEQIKFRFHRKVCAVQASSSHEFDSWGACVLHTAFKLSWACNWVCVPHQSTGPVRWQLSSGISGSICAQQKDAKTPGFWNVNTCLMNYQYNYSKKKQPQKQNNLFFFFIYIYALKRQHDGGQTGLGLFRPLFCNKWTTHPFHCCRLTPDIGSIICFTGKAAWE